MELFGRLTADAKVNETKDNRKVVNFSIAINDRYKQKDSDEMKIVTTFVNCSYWMSASVVTYLTKGKFVELYGRINAGAYMNASNELKASLNFHVNSLKFHGSLKSAFIEKEIQSEQAEPADDLPF
jgi:single-strand DNA-binding protein